MEKRYEIKCKLSDGKEFKYDNIHSNDVRITANGCLIFYDNKGYIMLAYSNDSWNEVYETEE